jgi:hypothetical protein
VIDRQAFLTALFYEITAGIVERRCLFFGRQAIFTGADISWNDALVAGEAGISIRLHITP